MATACLRLFTVGPVFEPEWSVPCLNSCMTVCTLACLPALVLGLRAISTSCCRLSSSYQPVATGGRIVDEERIIPTPREAVAAHRERMLAGIPRPKWKPIPADQLRLSEFNPREGIQQKWLDHYVQWWSDALADPLRVVQRKERVYDLVDGRHRLYAIRERGNKTYRFGCLVHEGLTREEEAA